MGHIHALVSCTRVKWEATMEEWAKWEIVTVEEARSLWADDPDYDAETDTVRLENPIEEYGWVDVAWSRYELHDSRNDVSPLVSEDEESEDLEDEVKNALGWLGAYEDNGDGTFYAADVDQPHDSPWDYDYAIHFTRKTYANHVWTQEPWHPVKDGGIQL